MVTFPEFQNVLSLPDVTSQTAPVPNLERRAASAGINGGLEEEMNTLKNLSISSLNLVSSKLLQMNIKGFSGSDLSEQFMLQDFTKYDTHSMYKSVAIVDSDTDLEGKSSNKSDTE